MFAAERSTDALDEIDEAKQQLQDAVAAAEFLEAAKCVYARF